jgi:pimeloyl-ACP methyl ester carboxylesterase
LQGRYRELRMPVTIMAGTQDRIVDHRRHAVRLSGEVPRSTLLLVPNAGHMVHYAMPGLVVEAMTCAATIYSGALASPPLPQPVSNLAT